MILYIFELIGLYLVIGWFVGGINQLIFGNDGSDRELIFIFSLIGWPIVFLIDLVAIIVGPGAKAWLDFVDDIPYKIKEAKQKRLKKKSGIEV